MIGASGTIYHVSYKKLNNLALQLYGAFFFFLGNFLLAASFLTCGEFQKSFDLFLKAAKGVYSEQFLMNRVSNFVGENSNHCILYFLKVSNVFLVRNLYVYSFIIIFHIYTLLDKIKRLLIKFDYAFSSL